MQKFLNPLEQRLAAAVHCIIKIALAVYIQAEIIKAIHMLKFVIFSFQVIYAFCCLADQHIFCFTFVNT